MANVIQLTVTGQDKSGPALASASANVQTLKKSAADSAAAMQRMWAVQEAGARGFAANRAQLKEQAAMAQFYAGKALPDVTRATQAASTATIGLGTQFKAAKQSLKILSYTAFPEAAIAADLFSKGMLSLIKTGSALKGVLGPIAAGLTAVGTVAYTAKQAMSAFNAENERLLSASKAASVEANAGVALYNRLAELKNAGAISADDFNRYKGLIDSGRANSATLRAGTAFANEAQARIDAAARRTAGVGEIDALANKMHVSQLGGFSAERAKAQQEYKQLLIEIGEIEQKYALQFKDVEGIRMAALAAYENQLDEIDAKERQVKDDEVRLWAEQVFEYDRAQREQTKIAEEEAKKRAEYEIQLSRTIETAREAEMQRRVQMQRHHQDLYVSMLGAFAQASGAFGKKGFEAWKAFSYAEAIVSTILGATRALADYPWPYNAIVAATVTATGMANVAQIAATEPPSYAIGSEFIPQTGPAIVHEGERIVQANINADLSDFLDRQGRGMAVAVYLDGHVLARGIGDMSRDGRLTISARAVR